MWAHGMYKKFFPKLFLLMFFHVLFSCHSSHWCMLNCSFLNSFLMLSKANLKPCSRLNRFGNSITKWYGNERIFWLDFCGGNVLFIFINVSDSYLLFCVLALQQSGCLFSLQTERLKLLQWKKEIIPIVFKWNCIFLWKWWYAITLKNIWASHITFHSPLNYELCSIQYKIQIFNCIHYTPLSCTLYVDRCLYTNIQYAPSSYLYSLFIALQYLHSLQFTKDLPGTLYAVSHCF